MTEMVASMASSTAGEAVPLVRSALFWAVLCTLVGFWLLLPGKGRRARVLGVLIGLLGLVCYGAELQHLAGLFGDSLFPTLAVVTLVACAATVTVRNPVYSAIWFALALLGVAALMLLQGAQFLGVATVVVYAGAIVVTFLFVLMLAQPTGLAPCDRRSWDAPLSAATGALMIGMLSVAVSQAVGTMASTHEGTVARAVDAASTPQLQAAEHTARLGAILFSRHLLAVDVAGVLLLVALIGAVAIVEQGRQRKGPASDPSEMR